MRVRDANDFELTLAFLAGFVVGFAAAAIGLILLLTR